MVFLTTRGLETALTQRRQEDELLVAAAAVVIRVTPGVADVLALEQAGVDERVQLFRDLALLQPVDVDGRNARLLALVSVERKVLANALVDVEIHVVAVAGPDDVAAEGGADPAVAQQGECDRDDHAPANRARASA